MKNTIVIIPALNEDKTIGNVIQNIKKYVKDIIVISDGSSDNTANISKENGALVIENIKNYGPEHATEQGIKKSIELGFDFIITFDADGQHPYQIIPYFIDQLQKNNTDIIVGCREKFPRFSEYLFSWYAKFKIGISDPINGLKGFKSDVFKDIGYFDTIKGMTSQILFVAYKKKFKIMSIPIKTNKRIDTPRIGGSIKANIKMLFSLIRIISNDIFNK